MAFPTYDREVLLRYALATMRNRMKVDATPGTFWYRLAETWADAMTSPSGQQKYIANQILPETSDSETLERHARIRGLTRKSARRAQGIVSILVTEE